MVDYSNPFLTSFLGSRNQFTQPQNQFNQPQNQYDFSGWGDRLGKIEEGIAGLTKQFNSFQKPGDVAPEYTGNVAPEPLEQSANAPEPLGGIESLVAEPAPPMGGLGGQQGPLFDPAPPGTVQLGGPNAPPPGWTPGKQGEQPTGWTPGTPPPGWTPGAKQDDMNFVAPWLRNMSSPHGGSSWEPRGAGGEPLSDYLMFQGPEGEERLAGLSGNLINYPPNMPQSTYPEHYATINPAFAEQFQYQGRPNDLEQPIGGPTREQQLQALQAGVGAPALGGPTQQKIQQGIGALV